MKKNLFAHEGGSKKQSVSTDQHISQITGKGKCSWQPQLDSAENTVGESQSKQAQRSLHASCIFSCAMRLRTQGPAPCLAVVWVPGASAVLQRLFVQKSRGSPVKFLAKILLVADNSFLGYLVWPVHLMARGPTVQRTATLLPPRGATAAKRLHGPSLTARRKRNLPAISFLTCG